MRTEIYFRACRGRRAVMLAFVAGFGIWFAGTGCGAGAGGFLLDTPVDLRPQLAGTVTDAATGEVLAGAVVTFQGQSVLSGADGMYFFTSVKAGSSTAEVNHGGYITATRDLVIGESLVNTADFELQPAN